MKKEIKPSYLILSIVGSDDNGLFHHIAKLCKTCQCLVLESHATQMATKLGAVMRISGSWNAIAKLETRLASLPEKWHCKILSERLEAPPTEETPQLAYNLQAVTPDRVGILSEITKFFYQRKITLLHLSNDTYSTSRSPTPMCAINATVLIPQEINITALRDQFMEHCEEHNLDAILEPQKLA